MKLFEGGIIEKITNDEYERMFKRKKYAAGDDDERAEGEVDDNGKSHEEVQQQEMKAIKVNSESEKVSDEKKLTAVNLRMLQGAFYLLILGDFMAFFAFIFESGYRLMRSKISSLNMR